jgi:hypothetical protein
MRNDEQVGEGREGGWGGHRGTREHFGEGSLSSC